MAQKNLWYTRCLVFSLLVVLLTASAAYADNVVKIKSVKYTNDEGQVVTVNVDQANHSVPLTSKAGENSIEVIVDILPSRQAGDSLQAKLKKNPERTTVVDPAGNVTTVAGGGFKITIAANTMGSNSSWRLEVTLIRNGDPAGSDYCDIGIPAPPGGGGV